MKFFINVKEPLTLFLSEAMQVPYFKERGAIAEAWNLHLGAGPSF